MRLIRGIYDSSKQRKLSRKPTESHVYAVVDENDCVVVSRPHGDRQPYRYAMYSTFDQARNARDLITGQHHSKPNKQFRVIGVDMVYSEEDYD